MTDELGHITRYVYDKAGNLTKTIFEDNTPATLDDNPFTMRTYDELNRKPT